MSGLVREDDVLALEAKGAATRAWLLTVALYLLSPAIGAALVDL